MLVAIAALALPGLAQGQDVPTRFGERTVAIGSLDEPKYSLSRISGVAVDGVGRVFVGQPAAGEIRVYDSRGRYLRAIGSRGEGPGEFGSVYRLGICGDSLWVSDARHVRVSWFRTAGEHLSTRSTLDLHARETMLPTAPEAVLCDGALLIEAGTNLAHVILGDVQRTPVVLVDPENQEQRVLFRRSVRDWRLVLSHAGSVVTSNFQPYSDVPLLEAHSPSSTLVLLRRDVSDVEPDESGSFSVTRITSRGDTLWHRAIPYRARPLSRTLRREAVRRVVEDMAGSEPVPRSARAAAEAALVLPDVIPPVSDLIVGRHGRIWIRTESAADEIPPWLVLDRDGEPAFRVLLPEDVRPVAVDGEGAWSVRHDELGIPFLERYELRP